MVEVGGEVSVHVERRRAPIEGEGHLDRVVEHRWCVLVANGAVHDVLRDAVEPGHTVSDGAAQGTHHAPFQVEQAELGAVDKDVERRIGTNPGGLSEGEGIDARRLMLGQRLQLCLEPGEVIGAAPAARRGCFKRRRNR